MKLIKESSHIGLIYIVILIIGIGLKYLTPLKYRVIISIYNFLIFIPVLIILCYHIFILTKEKLHKKDYKIWDFLFMLPPLIHVAIFTYVTFRLVD